MPFINAMPRRLAVMPETFENVFAPEISQDRLTVDQIIVGLTAGMIRAGKLPPDVQAALAAEMDRRAGEDMTPIRLLVLLLGAMGEVKYKTRLQKYAFLADNQYSQSQNGGKGADLLYRWKPHHYGPYSEDLNLCIGEAVDAKLISVFEIHETNKTPGVAYKLTVRGNAEYRHLLKTMGNVSSSIHDMLEKFQRDSSEHELVKFVYQMHPKYTTKSLIRDKFFATKGGL